MSDIRKFFSGYSVPPKKPRLQDEPASSASSSGVEPSSNHVSEMKKNIGNFCGRNLTEIEKEYISKKVWTPPKDFSFPVLCQVSDRKVKFQYSWLEEYPLSYSKQENGAFCLPCVVFAETGGVQLKPSEKLVKVKYDNINLLAKYS